MKIDNWIKLVVIVGVGVLLFFPKPEKNFFAYAGTFFVIVLVLVLLFVKRNKKVVKGKRVKKKN